MIFATLKIIHLLALVLGAGASLGNVYLLLAKGPADLPAPGLVAALRQWYRLSAFAAIVTLWVTGLLLAVMRYGWVSGFAFNAKLAFATLLLLLIVWLNFMAPGWARRGGPPGYVPALHVAGAALLVSAVVFAVIAFAWTAQSSSSLPIAAETSRRGSVERVARHTATAPSNMAMIATASPRPSGGSPFASMQQNACRTA